MKYKQKVRDKYNEFKANSVCKTCGLSGKGHPELIEFHHRDPKKKKDSVAHLVQQAQSWRVIKKEIDKCDVLCSEDHKAEHRRLGIPDPRNMPQLEATMEVA
jgi:hypothetical protein